MVVLLALVATEASGQPPAGGLQKVERVILLSGDEKASVQRLRVSPKVATLVMFDVRVLRESMDTRSLRPLFTRLEVNEHSLVLRLERELRSGSPPRLIVLLASDEAPRKLEFELVTDPDAVDTQVHVRHAGEEAEATRLYVPAESQGRCAATEADLAPPRGRCTLPGVAGLFVSGEMDATHGVRVVSRAAGEAVKLGVKEVWRTTIYRTGSTVMVGTTLENPPGGAPWGPGLARLTRLGTDGQPVDKPLLLPVTLGGGKVAPGERARVAVQWDEPADASTPAVRLEVVDAAGRGLRWERLDLLALGGDMPMAPRGRKESP
jgi:uncharacterized protein (TIGR02268 family)